MSSPKITTVAIAGASGSLGAPLTQALLDAGFTVTALTRPDSTSTFPAGVKIAKVDYTSKASLQSALTGQDALISTLTTTASAQQTLLIDAAVSAGVRRIIPSEFGSDTLNPKARALPVYHDKVAVQERLQQSCAESEGKTTYTLVLTNAFLDWGISHAFLIDTKKRTYEFMDSSDGYFTTTPLSFVAAGVVAILQRPDATANKAIRLQGARLTQKQFLSIVQRVVGDDGWTVTDVRSEDVERKAFEALKSDPGNVMEWLFPMLKLAIYAPGFGGDYGEKDDNEMLRLKQLSEKEVEEVVRSAV